MISTPVEKKSYSMNLGFEVYCLEASFRKVVLMENIVHIVRNIPEEDLMDTIDEVL